VKNSLELFIPSTGRAALQTTIFALPEPWQRVTTVVVYAHERRAYVETVPPWVTVKAVPERVQRIGMKRQWIVEQAQGPKICMLDDDLELLVRRSDEPAHFLAASTTDVGEMLETIERTLSARIPHVGVCPREGGNRMLEDGYCMRMCRVLAYHMSTLRGSAARFDRNPPMEDFDMTLQLLRLGHPNKVLHLWAHGQRGSNTIGGCSGYRTLKVQAETARRLARLHPGFVKAVQKTTKTAWGGATRTDVVVQWKKAYLSSGKALKRENDGILSIY